MVVKDQRNTKRQSMGGNKDPEHSQWRAQCKAEQPPASWKKHFYRVNVEIYQLCAQKNQYSIPQMEEDGSGVSQQEHQCAAEVINQQPGIMCRQSGNRVKLRACFNQQADRQADSTRCTKPKEPKDKDRLHWDIRHQREQHISSFRKKDRDNTMNELLRRGKNMQINPSVRDMGHMSLEIRIMAVLRCCHTYSTAQRLTDSRKFSSPRKSPFLFLSAAHQSPQKVLCFPHLNSATTDTSKLETYKWGIHFIHFKDIIT